MMSPTISIKAMNVELNVERNSLIMKKLAPLARLTPESDEVHFDVVIRKVESHWFADRYCTSVRMSTTTNKYYAVATEFYLEKAFSKVRDDLRRAVSRNYNAKEFGLTPMQQYIKDRQYLELFA